METEKSQICSQQARDPGGQMVWALGRTRRCKNQERWWYMIHSENWRQKNWWLSGSLRGGHDQYTTSAQARGVLSFWVPFRPSTDRMRPTHTVVGSCLSLKSTDLNTDLVQEWPHRNTQSNVCSNTLAPLGSAKSTHKVSHHTLKGRRVPWSSDST